MHSASTSRLGLPTLLRLIPPRMVPVLTAGCFTGIQLSFHPKMRNVAEKGAKKPAAPDLALLVREFVTRWLLPGRQVQAPELGAWAPPAAEAAGLGPAVKCRHASLTRGPAGAIGVRARPGRQVQTPEPLAHS